MKIISTDSVDLGLRTGMLGSNRNRTFWLKVWREAEPVMVHGVVVLLLDISLLLIGLVTLGLEKIFSKQGAYFDVIEKIDIWLVVALLLLFGAYTLFGLGIRLYKVLVNEVGKEYSQDEEL